MPANQPAVKVISGSQVLAVKFLGQLGIKVTSSAREQDRPVLLFEGSLTATQINGNHTVIARGGERQFHCQVIDFER